jgi:hypothetical protein
MSSTTDWITSIAAATGALGTVGVIGVSLWLARNQGRDTAAQRKRAQAEKITAWFVPYLGKQDNQHAVYVGLKIKNSSNQLIYDLIAETVTVQGAARKTAVGDVEERNRQLVVLVGNVPPGEVTTRINSGGGGMHIRHAIELAFVMPPDVTGSDTATGL